ncbi:MAG: aminomethyltransferase family protein, partial [Anaerolineae bacterium]|nr:aminomethyltransferase family protein [Anaerolineae bacterium]
SNWDKDWAWLSAVNQNEVVIDKDRPEWSWSPPALLRNLKDPASGADQRIDLALQGPRSLDILLACESNVGVQTALKEMKRTRLIETRFAGMELLIARTGYTGEPLGFELYVHPDQVVALWRLLLDKGAAFGVKPCGLAARDSTRVEAGLPLYGHDLAGPLRISPTEAGFDRYVKADKPFWVGKMPYLAYHQTVERQLVRFQVEKGARPLRGGDHGEPVVSTRGRVIGTVTSCAQVGEAQVGLALVEARYTEPGSDLLIYPETKRAVRKLPQEFEWGDTVALPVRAVVLPRFPQ